ncbi:MAG TPA: class I SAM-dependent methyltransferase [Xanthomonadaceae bacterium]|nr:class I SAM-dependent methyltransferase [Xanthomonadaceae bacterium]
MEQQERSPANIYEAHFVPALFGQWAPLMAELAAVGPGQEILDVACGTGVLSRAVADRVGTTGRVTGLDPNPDMLAVAQRLDGRIRWEPGRAESLPFADASFDAVVCQFGMMFFDDPAGALREMLRVLRPQGRLVVAVCDALDHSAGYSVFAELLHRLFGAEVAQSFRAPFALGDRERLASICLQAGLTAHIERMDGLVRFPSVADLVATERACAWTLGGLLDADQFERLRVAAGESLQPFVDEDGEIEFEMPALVIVHGT